MDLLIDTHAAIWFVTENEKLPLKTKKIIESVENTCYVSLATFWEIAIKHSLGRLDLHSDLKRVFDIIEQTGFELLPITTGHILVNASLSHHHHDPFDRIIIAQAIHEGLQIVTKDEQFVQYDVPVIWEK